MFAIELYRQYLYNSTKYISNTDKEKKLAFEHQKISEILDSLPNLFYMDKNIIDKDNISIYTYIKREILSEVVKRGHDVVISESGYFLRSVLSEINNMIETIAA